MYTMCRCICDVKEGKDNLGVYIDFEWAKRFLYVIMNLLKIPIYHLYFSMHWIAQILLMVNYIAKHKYIVYRLK